MGHLLGRREDGTDVLGVYPLFPDGTCRFLVFDFDNHEKGAEEKDFANETDDWKSEVDALRKICELNGIQPLVERSKSGRGAHVWIFFRKRIPASIARNFAFLLLDKGASLINLPSFQYYDRMYPSQNVSDGIGNLIALPLQGQALKKGNSAFVDSDWNAYPEQWDVILNHVVKLSQEEVEKYIIKWMQELGSCQTSNQSQSNICPLTNQNRPKPWRRQNIFQKKDVVGKMHIVLGDGVYVDTLNLMPQLQNQIRSMAAFDNPVYYKNKRLGYSNYYNFSAIYMGKDVDGYIRLPRGLREPLIQACDAAGISYDMEEQRAKGRPLRVQFRGDLRVQQDLAAQQLLAHDHGILNAATAFGKTVVCSYLIASRKVNTLILLQSKDLLEQWVEELQRFLDIDEVFPTYKTKTGREKRRDSLIGVLHGSKNTLTGIVDVAMVGSLYAKGKFNEMLNSYGMVIMDECHHCGSTTAIEVMQKVNARYVYGVSATPKRGDNLEKIIYMLLGPVRHSFTAKERAAEQGISHFVYPRFTRTVDTHESKHDINGAYQLISGNALRNEMIIQDTKACVVVGRTPVILTKYKEQARVLYEQLQGSADHVLILYGGNSDKENSLIRKQLKAIPLEESLILVATGQKIGEGFDCPRLDTLMLAAPVSFSGRLEQYIGRLNRDYEGKKDVIVYDYVDSHIHYFDNMYAKRLRTYRKCAYELISSAAVSKQNANAIYDGENYVDVFEQDMIETEKQMIICSPDLNSEKVNRFIYLVNPRQEAGVKVTVITREPDCVAFGDGSYSAELIKCMEANGINVILREEITEHFAVFDEELVWHGGMNLLGKADVWDNLMRIKDQKVAEELMGMV